MATKYVRPKRSFLAPLNPTGARGGYSRGGVFFSRDWTPIDLSTLTTEHQNQILNDPKLDVLDAPTPVVDDVYATNDELRAALRAALEA
jgi:hypothetical protein